MKKNSDNDMAKLHTKGCSDPLGAEREPLMTVFRPLITELVELLPPVPLDKNPSV